MYHKQKQEEQEKLAQASQDAQVAQSQASLERQLKKANPSTDVSTTKSSSVSDGKKKDSSSTSDSCNDSCNNSCNDSSNGNSGDSSEEVDYEVLSEEEKEELRLHLKRKHAQYVSDLAKTFDYSSFKNAHLDGCASYNGYPCVNFAEPTSFAKDSPLSEKGIELMSKRFRGFYPVVLDLETSGLDFKRNSILQIAAIALTFNDDEELVPYARFKVNVHPLEGKEVDYSAVMITEINPFDYQRKALPLKEALTALCKFVRGAQKAHGCKRSVIVAHNANFDTSFLYHYLEEVKVKRNPFHPFTNFDTSVLGAVFLGDTRLNEAVSKLGIEYDYHQAHDALYDTELCAKLFAYCVNQQKATISGFLAGELKTGYEQNEN